MARRRKRGRRFWGGDTYGYGGLSPYVPVDERRKSAAREVAALKKSGVIVNPVVIDGTKIATTFWGKAWCDHLEAHSDYANRLPRGRSYVRNGAVVDLRIEAGKVLARVQGSRLYTVSIDIAKVDAKRWKAIVAACAGRVGSVVELLQGKLSQSVMAVVTDRAAGLFPAPKEIGLRCSCPDWATMCKHVAATLYGVGARLDAEPEVLFVLRGALASELVASAATGGIAAAKLAKGRALVPASSLSSVFGIELDAPSDSGPGEGKATKRKPARPAPEKKAERAPQPPPPAEPKPAKATRAKARVDPQGATGKTAAKAVAKRASKQRKAPVVIETEESAPWLGAFSAAAIELREPKARGRA